MSNNQTSVQCSLCGQFTARAVQRPQIVGKGEQMVIVENVPMLSCRHCGHDYFSLEVARRLDVIRAKPQEITTRKNFAVAELV